MIQGKLQKVSATIPVCTSHVGWNEYSYPLVSVLSAIEAQEKKYGQIYDVRIGTRITPERGHGQDRDGEYAEISISFVRDETKAEHEARVVREEKEKIRAEKEMEKKISKEKELLKSLIQKHGVPK